MDDLTSAGDVNTANKTIETCNIMEQRKKITFNTKRGKSGYMIIPGKNIQVKWR